MSNLVKKVSFDVALSKMRALGTVLHRPMRDVLESAARTVALQCARSAQPFGTGAEALDAGRKAVARDISKVYKTPGAVYESISDPARKRAYWRAIKAGEFDKAQEIQDGSSDHYAGVPLRQFDGGTAHKSARGSNGRVRAPRPAMVVTDPRSLERYVEAVQKNVGFGKGGFADIARALGKNPRGLRQDGDITANWITRHRGFGKFSAGGSDQNPTIRITNSVHYADQILQGGALTEAKRIAHERMIENLRIAVSAETRSLRSAA